MKILFAVPRYHPNHDGMVAGLQAAGHDVGFLVRGGHPTEAHRPGVTVTRLPAPTRLRPLPPVRALAGHLRAARPDVVVARNPNRVSYALFLACRALGIPYLLYIQRAEGCEALHSRRRALLALGLWPRHTVNAIAAGPVATPAGKTCDFLPFAVDTEGYGTADPALAPPLRLLAVGKLDQPRKNHPALVRHLAPLMRAGRARLTILGLRDPGPNPAYDALQAEIAAQGVTAQVTLRENLAYAASRRLYVEHDLLVLASSRERASVAPAEALAAGIPVIAGADNGTNFLIREGETGHVFPDDDFAAMAGHVARLADHPAEIRRMGAAGRAMIAAEYSPAAYARRFEAIVARRFGCGPLSRPGKLG